MGTLGCISDMLRRDKENRELRRLGRERMKETRDRMIDSGKKRNASPISLEKLEEIIHNTQEKEESDKNKLFRIKLRMFVLIVLTGFLLWIIFTLFIQA